MSNQEEILKFLVISAANNLENNKKYINELNVFPVPDGDTGSNMSMTFTKAAVAIQPCKNDVFREWVMALLRSARGNSGVILSQLMRGIAKVADNATEFSPKILASMAKEGVAMSYRAVMKPTEGTILTVARDMANFADTNYKNYKNTVKFFEDIIAYGKISLVQTQKMLPVLKQAGVVDAGAAGLIVLLEGVLYALVNNKIVEINDQNVINIFETSKAERDLLRCTKFKYCTEFVVEQPQMSKLDAFKTAIDTMGDNIAIIEDCKIIKIHIHTDRPWFVLEKGAKLGEMNKVKIDNMKCQCAEMSKAREIVKYGFVAVSCGEGLTKLLKDLGVNEIVEGGQTMNPSAQDILLAIDNVNAEIIFVFPNNKNILLAANLAQQLCSKYIIVIPTKNFPESLSALTSFNADKDEIANKESMLRAIDLVSCASVVRAVKDYKLDCLDIKRHDIVGTVENKIVYKGNTPNEVAHGLVEMLKNDASSVISIFYGDLIDKDTANQLKVQLENKYPYCEISVHCGNQPIYYYILSVE